MMYKQTYQTLHPHIHTDGCLFMSLLDISCEAAGGHLSPMEINRVYRYAVPYYMKDGRQAHKNRCYILSHVEIIRAGMYILQARHPSMLYAYRKDGAEFIIGDEGAAEACNYWIAELDCNTYTHFVRINNPIKQLITYNPGRSTGPVISLRGYYVKIL